MKRRAQQRIVRGNARAAAGREPISWGYLLLTIVCASLMAMGFFLVAVQHFVTMDLGFKNSTLRREVQELEAEKRRLLLVKEVALSPGEIKRTAAKLGFREFESVIAVSTPETAKPAAADVARAAAPAARNAPVQARELTRTVSSQPISPARTVAVTAAVKPAGESRPRTVANKKENAAPATRTVAVVARLR